jgi:hypothetical protein
MRSKLTVDIAAAVIYLVAANPALTGLAVHEWISLGLVLVLLVHCAIHYDWIINTLRGHVDRASRANLVLDAITLIVFIACTISGVFVSRHILPTLGFVAPGYFFWNPIHALTAKALLALLLLHVIAHWRWFTSLFARRAKNKETPDTSADQWTKPA